VWAETFPDPDKKMAERMKQRRKIAKEQRELEEKQENMTPEEIEEMEKNIPEWKRNALVMTGEEVTEEKSGVFGKIKGKISGTDAAKNFK
jgi:predicted RNA-binding protein with PUA domain